MKNLLLTMTMLSCFCMAQFTAGTKSLSGSGTVTLADPDMTIDVDANVGYFAMDNIEARVGLTLNGTTDTMTDAMGYSFGANYYMGSMYGGGEYAGSTAKGSDGALDIRGGYLMGLGDSGNMFLDIFGNYNMPLGDGDGVISFGFGVATFF